MATYLSRERVMKAMKATAGRVALVLVLSWTSLLPAQSGNLRDHVHFHRDVKYAEVGHKTLKLDLYVPRDTQGILPCVVWIHGGAWRAGTKKNPRVAWLTQHGYVVASLQYRLSQEAIFPAQIHDCKGAIRWLRAHAATYSIDTDRIGVAGSSAGGHLAALLGTSAEVEALEGQTGGHLDQPSRVQAVLDESVRTFFDRYLKRRSPRAAAPKSGPPYTYVIVHGAWGGGWAFKEVERLLRADGHDVYRPTLTGQGEKVHLAHPDINLSTHNRSH